MSVSEENFSQSNVIDTIPAKPKEISVQSKTLIFGICNFMLGIVMGLWGAFDIVQHNTNDFFSIKYGEILETEKLLSAKSFLMFFFIFLLAFSKFIPRVNWDKIKEV
jgi:hypothetical protein